MTVCVILDVTVERQMLSDEMPADEMPADEMPSDKTPMELGGTGVTRASVFPGAVAVYITELTLLSPDK